MRHRPVSRAPAEPQAPIPHAGRSGHDRLVLTFLSVDLAEASETLARLAERRSTTEAAYRSIVRTAVATHGGWELSRQGDRIVAGFPTPTSAVEGAAAMSRASRWHNRSATDRLDIRVGIQVGETDGDWLARSPGSLPGPAVEALRLCSAASGGQILVSDLVSSLAHPRGVAFERSGLLEIRRSADTISTFEARLMDPPVAPLELPEPLLDEAGRAPFAGRREERDRLHAAWASAAAGKRRLAVIMGEAGAGKSRLAMELARDVHVEGGVVLWGRSSEDAIHPLRPFVDALRSYVTAVGPWELAWLPGPVRRELARVIPEICVRGGSGLAAEPRPEDSRHLYEAVNTLLSGVSIDAPVLLVLDDLQWADPASLRLLKSLVLDRRAASLMIVGIARDNAGPPSHPLARVLADIERERAVDRVALGTLGVADVAAMAQAALRRPMPEDLPAGIWEDSGGNAFFAAAIIEHVRALGPGIPEPEGDSLAGPGPAAGQATQVPPHIAIATLGVPGRVSRRLERRLQRLTPPAREMLSVAAAIGPQFGLDVLRPVLAVERASLVALVDEAIGAAVLREIPDSAGHYAFRHPIVRRALLERQTATHRALVRERISKVLLLRRDHRTATPIPVHGRTRRAGRRWARARRLPAGPVAMRRGTLPEAPAAGLVTAVTQ